MRLECTWLTGVTSRESVRTWIIFENFVSISRGETFGQNSAIDKLLDLFEEAGGRINVPRERKNCWEKLSGARGLGKGLKEH